jgi:trans-2-enoyl-CoA reductase
MRAVGIAAFGEPIDVAEVIDVAEPAAPGAGEVLLGMDYAPVNPADLLLIRGIHAGPSDHAERGRH